jgi:hypothetical protein
VLSAGMVFIRAHNLVKELDLVERRLCVMRRRTNNLERNMLPIRVVS